VVNDSLVLVDFINKREARGMRHIDAVKDAGAARFRAVMLTSLTTFLGLMPLLFEKSVQAQFLIPMATSLAFGILFATIITLFLVPSLYLILDDIRRTLRAIVRLYTPQPSEVDAGAGDGTYARSREESPGGRGRETSLIV